MIVINTKNYKTGDALLALAKLIESIDIHTIVAVPASDVYRIAARTSLNVYAQHVDYIGNEKTTGFIGAASIRALGGTGTILNHAEHPLGFDILKKTIEQCKKAKIVTLVCASSLEQAKKIATLRPEMIAFEDPTLIGTGKSITAHSNRIEAFVKMLKGKSIVPLCGSGISRIEDVLQAYKLGCKGVLIASALANVSEAKVQIFMRSLKETI